jgi:thiamine-phosphate pyrophosphorylase
MSEPIARLCLVTPIIGDANAFARRLGEACGAGGVASVTLRLGEADQRTLVNAVKALAPPAQERGAAVLVAFEGEADPVAVAARGGADGVHVNVDVTTDPDRLRHLRDHLKGDRILGCGGLTSRDDAMTAGEAGVDYLLFGEPSPDGALPSLDDVVERAAWWAEIFETPCVAFAPDLAAVPRLAATGSEFVAFGDAVWRHPQGSAAAVEAALLALAGDPAQCAKAGAT